MYKIHDMDKDKSTDFEYYTIDEAAEKLNLSRISIYRLIYKGKLTAYKPAGIVYLKKSEVNHLIESHPIKVRTTKVDKKKEKYEFIYA